jgi:hypothetical protein
MYSDMNSDVLLLLVYLLFPSILYKTEMMLEKEVCLCRVEL